MWVLCFSSYFLSTFIFVSCSVRSWHGSEMLWEEILDVVVCIVSVVESVVSLWIIVWGMGITGIGVTVEVNDHISHIVLFLKFFVVSYVSVGELIRVLRHFEEEIHVLLIDWEILERGVQLKE